MEFILLLSKCLVVKPFGNFVQEGGDMVYFKSEKCLKKLTFFDLNGLKESKNVYFFGIFT